MSEYLKLGLLGHPLSHALSPVLQSAALQYSGIAGEYNLFDIKPENLAAEVKEMLTCGINGFNITIPYKQSIYKMVNTLTEDAKQVGAVNTVKVGMNNRLFGHNTDVIGFKLALSEGLGHSPINSSASALILGAGGSARAVVIALAQLGIKQIQIKGRDPKKIPSFISEMNESLAKNKYDLVINLLDERQANISELNLIVNATPIGLKQEAPPEWLIHLINRLNDQCFCFDLVYGQNGSAPTFTKLALDKGLKAIDGLPMLVHQARYAFEFWTGIIVPAEVMYTNLQSDKN